MRLLLGQASEKGIFISFLYFIGFEITWIKYYFWYYSKYVGKLFKFWKNTTATFYVHIKDPPFWDGLENLQWKSVKSRFLTYFHFYLRNAWLCNRCESTFASACACTKSKLIAVSMIRAISSCCLQLLVLYLPLLSKVPERVWGIMWGFRRQENSLFCGLRCLLIKMFITH